MRLRLLRVYGFAILAMSFWALSFVWIKIVYRYYFPVMTIFIRLVIATALLAFIIAVFRKKEKIDRKDVPWFFILAFFEPFCYFLGESYGMYYITPTMGAVIVATIPLFSPVIAFIWFRERLSLINSIGILFCFIGVLAMILNRDMSLAAPLHGILLEFFAVFSALVYSGLIKKLAGKYSPLTILTIQNGLGALYFLPLFLIIDFNHFISVTPSSELIMALLQLVIFGSILAFLLYIYAIRDLGITRANIFVNLIPVFTAVFSFFLIDEVMTAQKIAGIGIVVGGLMLTQVRSRKKMHAKRT